MARRLDHGRALSRVGVKPATFTYVDPPTLDEVLAVLDLHRDDAAVLAGGQSLVPLMNMRLARPDVVVDPRRVPGLRSIAVTDTEVVVGALTTTTDLLEHPDVSAAIPGLAEATGHIGHSQIRNRGTVGGSIAHADPSAELPAVLVALGGHVVLRSTDGERRVPASDLFDGPFSTTRRPHELVTEVHFPRVPGRSGWTETARRPGDFALVGVFAALALEPDGTVVSVHLALAGVADRPVRPQGAIAALVGESFDQRALAACADALRAEIDPADDVHATGAHRLALALTLTDRLLRRLAD
jgi:carbon-monoxide dehydrogenase medium subunit